MNKPAKKTKTRENGWWPALKGQFAKFIEIQMCFWMNHGCTNSGRVTKQSKDKTWYFSQHRQAKKYLQTQLQPHKWIGVSFCQYWCFHQFGWWVLGQQYLIGIIHLTPTDTYTSFFYVTIGTKELGSWIYYFVMESLHFSKSSFQYNVANSLVFVRMVNNKIKLPKVHISLPNFTRLMNKLWWTKLPTSRLHCA